MLLLNFYLIKYGSTVLLTVLNIKNLLNMFEEYLTLEIGNNTTKDYLLAIAFIVIGILVVRIFKKTFLQKIKKLTQKTSTNFDDYLIEAIEKYFSALKH